MICKESFIKYLNTLVEFKRREEDFNSSLREHLGCYPESTFYDDLVDSYIKMLNEFSEGCTNEVFGNDIEWWLYEDVDKIITLNNKTEIDVTTPEALYDYLVTYAKENENT